MYKYRFDQDNSDDIFEYDPTFDEELDAIVEAVVDNYGLKLTKGVIELCVDFFDEFRDTFYDEIQELLEGNAALEYWERYRNGKDWIF